MERDIAVVKFSYALLVHSISRHRADYRGQFIFRFGRQILRRLANGNCLERYMDLLNEPVILRTQLGHVGTSLLQFTEESLMLQLIQCLAQSGLSNPKPHGPFLLDNTVPAA